MSCPPLTLPAPDAMVQALRLALPQFAHVDWVDRIGSTNAVLLEKTRTAQLARPCLQGAHLQEQGRGRAARVWQNRAGACLMFSCAFDIALPPHTLPLLSPLSGMAACLALRTHIQPEHRHALNLKWPNDVLWRGGKLAGILVETRNTGSPQQHIAVMGMGINLCDAVVLSKALQRPVADWSTIAGVDADAAARDAVQLVASIAQSWQDWIARLQAGDDGFIQHYTQVDALANQTVHILNEGRVTLSGTAQGVNALGQLLVQTDNAPVAVTVGEVSVRTP